MNRSKLLAVPVALVMAAALAACGGSDSESSAAPAKTGSLTGICPDTIGIQLSWFPEAEYGGAYNLIGPDGEFDATKGIYSGPLGDTGVNVAVHAGGPLTGNDQVTAQLYKDDSLMIGLLATDEAIQNSAKQPTIAVMNYFDKDPQILMYDPDTYDFQSIADIGKTDTKVLYFEGSTYMDYLTGSGLLKKDQVDGSYQGGPDRFVGADGKLVQSGLATGEPYRYEKEISQWKKPVKDLLVYDSGYVNYASSYSVIPETEKKYSECLSKFIPMAQKAMVDYLADPKPMTDKITEMNADLGEFWQTTADMNAYSVGKMTELGLVENDDAGVFGNFDETRIQKMIDILTPIFKADNKEIKEGLTPADLYTNKYVDQSIGLG
jgi:hypothetical protein